MKIGSLCTGYGGLDHAAARHYSASTAWHAENAAAPSRVLAHHHPDTPNLGDLTAIDWANVEPVDIITAGYPCQPFSTAGLRKGTRDPRHLWPSYAPAIRRWEAVLGRVAPAPTVLSRTTGRPVLNPELVEWMLGLAPGYVTSPAIGLTHAAQLRTLGNGVVPAQAELALRLLDPQPP